MDVRAIKHWISTVLVGVAMGSTIPAQATLVSGDWLAAGDGLLVRDTNTNLEWLSLTQTFGMSYTDVAGQFGTGGSFDGMRYATNQEVMDLFSTYFAIDLSENIFPERIGYLDPGARLASETLGDGVSGGTDANSGPNANYFIAGLTSDLRVDGSRFMLGVHTRWSDTDYFTVKDPWWSGFDLVTPSDITGSYLVRAVPVPATVWLFGSGLLGLVGIARRKRQ